MAAEVITTEDLNEFKHELLDEIETLIKSKNAVQPKKWLKSSDVRELLDISPGTLQNLRINGTLPYSKMGGVIFYDYDDILNVMQENRIHNKY
tara:strand:- start:24 stop:302 length:279 start_codon:yes stop_codon:yes gene_type:complete